MIVKAPWTVAQVTNLNAWQANDHVHPFTCYNGTPLRATQQGWVCACCDYTQDWAHSAMLEGQPDYEA